MLDCCFQTSELRIEVDTSAETGIADWNYIVSVARLQPAPAPRLFLRRAFESVAL